MIRIAMDAYGGDNAPHAAIEGAVLALGDHEDIFVTLVGREAEIREQLAAYSYDKARLAVLDAPQVIDCHEQPTAAIKRKKDSSLVKAVNLVASGEADAVLSAGSTGALLAGATLIIKRIKGVKRPALAPLLPTVTGSWMMLIDCGANTDSKPSYLQQFAVMGSAYMRGVMDVQSPRVALLNNGTEAEKGNELTKAAHKLIAAAPINFVGNLEARDVLSGDADVLVCDGFDGNIVLKHTEGLVSAVFTMLKAELMADARSKLGAALAKPAFKRLKKKMDYTEYGGAALLGVNGGVIKAHGSSDAKAFRSAFMQARKLVLSGVAGEIEKAVAALPEMED